jgi:excisionase family DNA binding protein
MERNLTQGVKMEIRVKSLLGSKELGEVLGLPTKSIWRLARQRRIPSVRIGRLLRFDEDAVLQALGIMPPPRKGAP